MKTIKQKNSKTFKKKIALCLITAICALQLPVNNATAATGVPKMLSYQGRLLDSSGNLLGGANGTAYCMKFSLWTASSSGSRVWPTNAPSTSTITITNGVFNAAIGDTSIGGDALDFNFQTNDEVYLDVGFGWRGGTCASGGDETMETLAPRQRVYSAGYAINSDMVDGYHAVEQGTSTQIAVLSNGALILGSSTAAVSATSSNTLTIQGYSTGDINFFSSATGTLSKAGTPTIAGLLQSSGAGNNYLTGNLSIGTSTAPTGAVALFNGNISILGTASSTGLIVSGIATTTNLTITGLTNGFLNAGTNGVITTSSVAVTDFTSPNISQWTNNSGYITTSSISETITGIDYNNTTGVFSQTSGYEIPTTASTSVWNAGGTSYWTLSGTNLYPNSVTYKIGIGTTTPATFFTVASSSSNFFNVTDTGNVGIGTTNPQTKLDITGTASSTGLIVSGIATTTNLTITGLTNGFLNAGTNGVITTSSVAVTDFTSPNISQWTNNSGYITTSSISETITGIDYNNTTGVFSQTSGYEIPTTASTSVWNAGGTSYWTLSGTNLYPNSVTYKIGIGTTTPATFFTVASSSSNFFNVTDTGNVGIGTTNPQTKLDITGTASSTGLIVSGIATTTNLTITGLTNGFLNAGTNGVITTSSVAVTDFTSPNISQWTNNSGYITTSSISETITGIDYNNTTGVFSQTSGYEIPTTASTSVWNAGGGNGYWTLSGTNLYPNSVTYKIGIGTATPQYTFDVVGTSRFFSASSSNSSLTTIQAGTGKMAEFKAHLPGASNLMIYASNNELATILNPKSSLQFKQKSSVAWTAKSAWNTPDIGSSVAPAFADLDNDGDYDLLIGNTDGISYGYENTGTAASSTWTAKSAWDTPDIGSSVAPAFADLDNDGDYDLLIGSSLGTSYGYENTGTVTSPTWTAKSDWNAPNFASSTRPAFADLDNDGDYDLLIGETNGTSYGYENTGLDTFISFGKFGSVGIGTTTPATFFTVASSSSNFFNITGDGKVGIGTATPQYTFDVVGTSRFFSASSSNSSLTTIQAGTGKMAEFKAHLPGASNLMIYASNNELATILNPKSSLQFKQKSSVAWTAKSAWNTPDIGSSVRPAFADLDNDGDYDLLIGSSLGISYGYENTGTAASSTWTAKSAWDTPDIGSSVAPAFVDLDNDGDYDLLIGETNGTSSAYENTGTATSPTWTAKSDWNAPNFASSTRPAFADLDNDGDYDLLIGETNGTSYGYENTGLDTFISFGKFGSIGIGTTTPATFFTVASSSSNFFNITGDGKVGIGTATPQYTFDVVGTSRFFSASSSNSSLTTIQAGTGKMAEFKAHLPGASNLMIYASNNELATILNPKSSLQFKQKSSVAWTAKSAWNTPNVGSTAAPAFVDLDNDGDYDLLIGESVGISYGYENTGTVASSTWTAKSAWNTPDVGGYVRPAFADLDNDGDYDLLIADTGGISYGYENTGTAASSTWTAKSA